MSLAFLFLSGQRDSNSQHSAWKADTLPIELYPHYMHYLTNCNAKIVQFLLIPKYRLRILLSLEYVGKELRHECSAYLSQRG